jgi:hypothetical protein
MLTVRARRLVLLLAALTALLVTGCAGVTTTSGSTRVGAQNRVWAFTPAAQPPAPPTTSQSSCSRPGFTAPAVGLASGFCVATEEAGAASRLVIGRTSDVTAPGALQPGEYTLLDRLTPNLGDPQLNWIRNSSVLRQELRSGIAQIRDASPGNTGGQFLNAERNILMNRGWTFDSSTSTWNAP